MRQLINEKCISHKIKKENTKKSQRKQKKLTKCVLEVLEKKVQKQSIETTEERKHYLNCENERKCDIYI